MSPYRNYSGLLLMKKMEGRRRKKRRKKRGKDGEKGRKRKERKPQTGAYLLAAEEDELSNGTLCTGDVLLRHELG